MSTMDDMDKFIAILQGVAMDNRQKAKEALAAAVKVGFISSDDYSLDLDMISKQAQFIRREDLFMIGMFLIGATSHGDRY